MSARDGFRAVAEVDGNRTRRTGIARPTRFEGGGAHQVPGHLRPGGYRAPNSPDGLITSGGASQPVGLEAMKKLLILAVLIALGAVAAKKLRAD